MKKTPKNAAKRISGRLEDYFCYKLVSNLSKNVWIETAIRALEKGLGHCTENHIFFFRTS